MIPDWVDGLKYPPPDFGTILIRVNTGFGKGILWSIMVFEDKIKPFLLEFQGFRSTMPWIGCVAWIDQ